MKHAGWNGHTSSRMLTNCMIAGSTPAALDKHREWDELQAVLQEQWRSAKLSDARRRSAEERLQEVHMAIKDGEQLYNDGLSLAARRLHMSINDLVEEWQFECDWRSQHPCRRQKPQAKSTQLRKQNMKKKH